MKIRKIDGNKPVDANMDGELAAVITAAVMAAMEGSTYRLKASPFRRAAAGVPIWNMVSRIEQIDSRKMILGGKPNA